MPYRIIKYRFRENRSSVTTYWGYAVQQYERRWYWPWARWWTISYQIDEESSLAYIKKHRHAKTCKLGVRHGEVIKVEV